MSNLYDWPAFYRALCEKAPGLLTGIDAAVKDEIALQAKLTDDFWSESLEALLEMGAVDGDIRQGTRDALRQWGENVSTCLENFPYSMMASSALRLDLETAAAQEVIAELAEAAQPKD